MDNEIIHEEIPSDQESVNDDDTIDLDSEFGNDSDPEVDDDSDIIIQNKKKRLRVISSSSSSSENSPVTVERKKTPEKSITWARNGSINPAGVFSSYSGPTHHITNLSNPSPYDMCCQFISDDIVNSIVFQTNLYAEQQGNRYTPTNEEEIRTFIGINFTMGINKLPSYRDPWSTVPYLRNEYICRLMTVNRFGWLLSHIHLNDNMLIPARGSSDYAKLYQIRPFLDKIQENFKKKLKPSLSLAIDESMIKFKGRSAIKQYLPKKTIKRGYKVWMMADKSGYCYRFELYTGKIGKQVTKNLGEKVVNTLTSDLDGKEHTMYFDNYFTSVNLMENLKSRIINACDVVNKTRKYLPSFNKKLKHRGEYESFVSDTGISATKWMDNNEVHILSNFHDPNKLMA